MHKGQPQGIRPPTFLRCGERAAHVMQALTRGIALPPHRATQYRKWRARGDQPSPVERVERMLVELHGVGVSIAALRRVPRVLDELLDDLSTGAAHPRVTLDALLREADLEHAENAAVLRVAAGDRSAPALHALADALEAEALHQLELARAARHEARTLHLASH